MPFSFLDKSIVCQTINRTHCYKHGLISFDAIDPTACMHFSYFSHILFTNEQPLVNNMINFFFFFFFFLIELLIYDKKFLFLLGAEKNEKCTRCKEINLLSRIIKLPIKTRPCEVAYHTLYFFQICLSSCVININDNLLDRGQKL